MKPQTLADITKAIEITTDHVVSLQKKIEAVEKIASKAAVPGPKGADGAPGKDGRSIMGPMGPQGPQGKMGIMGPQGPAGADGNEISADEIFSKINTGTETIDIETIKGYKELVTKEMLEEFLKPIRERKQVLGASVNANSSGGVQGSGTAPQIAYWDNNGELTGDARLTWDSASALLDLFDLGGNGTLRISPSTGFFGLGNWSGGSNGSAWIVDESIPSIYGQSKSSQRFVYDGLNEEYWVGGIANKFNGLKIDDDARITTIGNLATVPDVSTGNFTKIVIDDSGQTIQGFSRVGFVPVPLFFVGGSNTAFGKQAMEQGPSGGGNSAFGSGAGQGLTTGFLNMFIGELAGNSTSTGTLNVAIGAGALRYNSGGDGNIGIGYRAAEQVDGDGSIMIGNGAGYQVQSGSNNIFIGSGVSNNWITTSEQIAIGSGSFLGDVVTANNTGVDNLVFGVGSGNTISSGDRNTIIGHTADTATAGTDDAVALGYGAVAKTATFALPAAVTKMYLPLAAYDDDAAAGLAGLVTGEWYQLTGMGAGLFAVAPGTVIIKQ